MAGFRLCTPNRPMSPDSHDETRTHVQTNMHMYVHTRECDAPTACSGPVAMARSCTHSTYQRESPKARAERARFDPGRRPTFYMGTECWHGQTARLMVPMLRSRGGGACIGAGAGWLAHAVRGAQRCTRPTWPRACGPGGRPALVCGVLLSRRLGPAGAGDRGPSIDQIEDVCVYLGRQTAAQWFRIAPVD